MEERFNAALKLYDDKRYAEAADAALTLTKEKICVKESFFLFAKSYLFLIDDPINRKELLQSFYNALNTALLRAESSSEFNKMTFEITETFNHWKENVLKIAINRLELSPSFDNWKAVYTLPAAFCEIWCIIIIQTRKAKEALNFEVDDNKRYENPYELTEDTWHSWVFNAGCKIFADGIEVLERDKFSSAEYCESICDNILLKFMLSDIIVDYCIPDDNDFKDSDTALTYLKKHAEILHTMLSAMLYPNGNAVTVYQSNREEKLNELKNTYAKICELEPEFVVPGLPDVECITLSLNSTEGSGGCYVATSIYGSYDCPQVWTLRRYRDMVLAKSFLGRIFIRCYYSVSPTLVKWFGNAKWFKKIFRSYLDKKVYNLNNNGIEDTEYQDRRW